MAESRSDHPLVDMQMMRQRTVWTTNLTAFLFGFGMFGSFILVPALVELPASSGVGFGASVTQAGLYLLPSTAGMLLVSPIAGRLSNRIGSRIPLIAGSLVTRCLFRRARRRARPAVADLRVVAHCSESASASPSRRWRT